MEGKVYYHSYSIWKEEDNHHIHMYDQQYTPLSLFSVVVLLQSYWLMASKLSFSPITDLSLPSDVFPKPPQRIPIFPHLPLNLCAGYHCSKSISSSSRVSVCHAVKEQQVIQSPNSDLTQNSQTDPPASSKLVLVVGGSGGVGQLVVASLLTRNIKSRLLLRDPEKATSLFGKQDEEKLQVWKGDTRNPEDLDPSLFEGVTHVICCTGTTAFPSRRWDGDNTPERTDWEGVRNLVSSLPASLKRIVLVSSVGVTKFNELPWSVMNLFGVLKYKKMGEDFVRNSGLPFTIIRPGRLTDGPYTSYDLNTLLKATAGERRAVVVGQGDKLVGEVSRLVVAEACIQALDIEFTEGEIYELNSVKGEGPGSDPQKWRELFKAAQVQ
ncbi:sanguinarine reductase-like isoform X2 [Rhododendron vialii]|uniref:sanguinarine reductase-like isoform X2 n=1 Tax=Rhododendron vialii TaxID=182163 RepID=UPI00265E3012|nr:sanguinarine reductase-like isoform X2 [Rhododendron vialii]